MTEGNRKKWTGIFLLAGMMLWSGCRSSYEIVDFQGGRVEMNSVFDKNPDAEAMTILAPYKAVVDSMMTPVIGRSAVNMTAYRPESPLSNLVADILREAAVLYTGETADVGIVNMGGLRNDLPQGDITYGDIYEIVPFENSLCILTMEGDDLEDLFEEIAKVHGEGLSGAQLEITHEGDLEKATVGGKEIDEDKMYTVATINYLAEGNDGMSSFTKAKKTVCPQGATLRKVFLDYVTRLSRQGKEVDSRLEGRIKIVDD